MRKLTLLFFIFFTGVFLAGCNSSQTSEYNNLINQGVNALKGNKYDEALSYLHQAIRLDPKDKAVLDLLKQAQVGQEKINDLRKFLVSLKTPVDESVSLMHEANNRWKEADGRSYTSSELIPKLEKIQTEINKAKFSPELEEVKKIALKTVNDELAAFKAFANGDNNARLDSAAEANQQFFKGIEAYAAKYKINLEKIWDK